MGSRSPRLGRTARRRLSKTVVYALCILGSVLMLIPLAWLLRSSFMGIGQIFRMDWTSHSITSREPVETSLPVYRCPSDMRLAFLRRTPIGP